MAIYNPNPRGQVFQPGAGSTVRYYIFLVDIPTAWGSPKFDPTNFTYNNGVLTCTADIAFPADDPQDLPLDKFKTFMLEYLTDANTIGLVDMIQVQGNVPVKDRVIKCGQINNSAPKLIFEERLKSANLLSGVARPFVILNYSNQQNYFFVGACVTTPGINYSNKGTVSQYNNTSQLVFRFLPDATINTVVDAFGCIPVDSRNTFTSISTETEIAAGAGDRALFDFSHAIVI